MALMVNVGASMKTLGGLVKGDIAYDATMAEAALRTIFASAAGFPAQFPEDSKEGHNTEASLKIWEDRAGFNAAAAKFVTDSEAAVMAKPADADALKAVFGQVASNCRACHTDYRAKR